MRRSSGHRQTTVEWSGIESPLQDPFDRRVIGLTVVLSSSTRAFQTHGPVLLCQSHYPTGAPKSIFRTVIE